MQKFQTLIAAREDWLIDRIVFYAKEQGYTEFTSTLREAWRASIVGLSESLIDALSVYDAPPDLLARQDFSRHPIAAFGVSKAREHRAHGVTLSLFLGLTKYYRQCYIDLLADAGLTAAEHQYCSLFVARFFDLIELGFCSEWTSVPQTEKLEEIQERNRAITNEKNKYLTIFESLNDPVVLLDENGALSNLNYAAHALFFGPDDPGATYYGHREESHPQEQIMALLGRALESEDSSIEFETRRGTRCFNVRLQRMLDISEKFLGTVLILHDVTEHKRARDQAEAANRAKSAFLATMSHEIRTPINGVLGIADLLCDTPLTKKQQHYLRGITASGTVLMGVLNDILDYSKIEAGVINLETVDFDLRKILKDVRTVWEPEAAAKELRFSVEIDEALPPYLRGDPGKIRQVLLNLTNNAIKFTAEGSITIRVCRSEKIVLGVPALRFEVADTGIGVPDQGSDRLFEPFTQQDSSTSRLFGGTGLGLAICKRLVEVMGGAIDCRLNEDGGSTFGFHVPLYKSMAGALRETRPADPGEVRPLSVLLVEDNEVNQLVTVGFLARRGHAVTTADCGEDALTILADRSFDLILMDQRMPGLSGLETLQHIRALASETRSSIPVIVTSASVLASEMESCFRAGADGFLAKPFRQEELDRAIASCLNDRTFAPSARGGGTGTPDPVVPSAEASSSADVIVAERADLIDNAVLKGHIELLGESRALRIVEAFQTSTQRVVDAMQDDLAAGALVALADRAHGLKSAAHNVGLVRVAGLADGLEARARAGDTSGSSALFADLEQAYAASRPALQSVWNDLMANEVAPTA